MLQRFLLLFGLLFAVESYAATTEMSLLDNRFRVDPTISQITFVIYRSNPSKPVVLVRPDGVKYYAWRHPDNVRWYQEQSMDIVSIDKPMPGPWQAVGKVTPKNNIKLISNLELSSQKLPLRLYQGEELKFSAQLTSDGKPLTLRDFLDRVNLRVTLVKYLENADQLAQEALPEPIVLGEFSDDGRGFDEVPGDGQFTAGITISAEPGKYIARITSGNGVFLRAQEQEVLVYPSPITTTFIQSRIENNPHHIIVTGDNSTIAPGSLLAHIDHSDAYDRVYSEEGEAGKEGFTVNLSVPYNGEHGNFKWDGRVYANEFSTNRPLRFSIPEHTYSVVDEIDFEKTRKMQEEAAAAQRKIAEQQAILEQREAQRTKMTTIIIVINLLAIILGVVGWIVFQKVKAKRAMKPEMQLNMPDD
ncbi:TIGR03503 family protein [Vibrio sp.]|uniref:TIGR03503 family protein n=1 Tax=Vibrio viridaestus TaxID=2487322 RepID=A0A3N9TK71_9VIBR|nr:TIGR03503 family protein [Vibrio viridaestus]MDC0609868.1 TIGR03503 family protein [Vibrio sp.]RQW63965.1 TIGR03503 family protein [Vibrio viridaestus]